MHCARHRSKRLAKAARKTASAVIFVAIAGSDPGPQLGRQNVDLPPQQIKLSSRICVGGGGLCSVGGCLSGVGVVSISGLHGVGIGGLSGIGVGGLCGIGVGGLLCIRVDKIGELQLEVVIVELVTVELATADVTIAVGVDPAGRKVQGQYMSACQLSEQSSGGCAHLAATLLAHLPPTFRLPSAYPTGPAPSTRPTFCLSGR